MRALLPTVGEGANLTSFLPPPSEARAQSPLQRRAALATTFLAGLELGRDGLVALAQDEAFDEIRLRRNDEAVVLK